MKENLYWKYEGKSPREWDIRISWYKGRKYTINREGIVKSLKGDRMKYIFRESKSPYVVIKISYKNKKTWKIEHKYKEVSVIQLMENFFWKHIAWYKATLSNPNLFRIVPKDNDWNNLAWNNLVYVNKEEYRRIGTRGKTIEWYLSAVKWKISDQELEKKFLLSRSWINKIRKRLLEEWKIQSLIPKEVQDLNMKISYDMIPVYRELLESKGQKSNKEIAVEVFSLDRNNLSEKEKNNNTEKVRRARKRLEKKGELEKYKVPGAKVTIDEVREELIEMLENKMQSWKTHKQIAEILGFTKYQVDNFSGKWKKSKERVRKKLAALKKRRENKS